jgi:hypothetical protein
MDSSFDLSRQPRPGFTGMTILSKRYYTVIYTCANIERACVEQKIAPKRIIGHVSVLHFFISIYGIHRFLQVLYILNHRNSDDKDDYDDNGYLVFGNIFVTGIPVKFELLSSGRARQRRSRAYQGQGGE